MVDIYDRIKEKREELGLSQYDLALKTGYKSRSSINKIEKGLRDINQRQVVDFANALNTTPAFLMGWEETTSNNDNQFDIFSVSNIIQLPNLKEIPLLGTIACGTPILADGNIQEYLKVPIDKNVDFALECKGDSMINARIYDGDIVFIKLQSDVNDGEIAAVLIDEEATLKKVYKYPSKIVLRACNPTFDDMIYTNEELNQISIIGKAVMFMSNVR